LTELWVENRLMLELLTPKLKEGYLQAMNPTHLKRMMEQLAAVPARG